MCIGFNRVLDAGINSERSITIIIGVRRFDEPFPLAGLTGSGIHTGSTTWTMSVGGPSSGTGIACEAVPKPTKSSNTVSTLTPVTATPITRPLVERNRSILALNILLG